jgi:hypothetical protein
MPKINLLKKKNKTATGNHFYRSNRPGYHSYWPVYQKNHLNYAFSLRIWIQAVTSTTPLPAAGGNWLPVGKENRGT